MSHSSLVPLSPGGRGARGEGVILSLTLFTLLFLCATPTLAADDAKLTRRQTGDLAIQSRAILRQFCAECHSDGAGKQGRLAVLDFDTITANVPVAFANKLAGEKSQILEFLVDGSMPPAGKSRPTAEQIETIRKWIAAETPSYPKAFDDRTTRQRILEDVKKLEAKDVKYYRYISLAHLVDAKDAPSLATAEQGMQKALISASNKLDYVPEPIDPTATVFRLDLRPVKWETRDLFEKITEGKQAGVASITPFDLLLLEYPYATTLPPGEEEDANAFLVPARQLRPVMFLKGDWLAEALKKGSQLNDEMLALTQLAIAKADDNDGNVPGPIIKPFANAKPFAYTLPRDGTTLFPPLFATTLADVAGEPPPFTLTLELVGIGGVNAITTVPAGSRYNLRLKTEVECKLQLLNVQADGEISLQAVTGGDVVSPGKTKVIAPGNSTERAFLASDSASTEYFIVMIAKKQLPLPQIVRSKHSKNFIWRFYYPEPLADSTNVIRKLVPINIVAKKK